MSNLINVFAKDRWINKCCVLALLFSAIVSSKATETIIIRPTVTDPSSSPLVAEPASSYDGNIVTKATIPKPVWLIVNTPATSDLGKINSVFMTLQHQPKPKGGPFGVMVDFYWVINNTWSPSHSFISMGTELTTTTLDVTTEYAWDWTSFGNAKLEVNNYDGNTDLYAFEVYFTVNYSSWPKILKAETVDDNLNGKIDAYRLTFNVPMDDSSLTVPNAWFQIAGRANVSFNPAGLPNNPDTNPNVIYLSFQENSLPDTDQTPDITYTPGSFRSLEGAELEVVVSTDVIETDKAGPFIVAAQAQDNNGGIVDTQTNDFVLLTFSEGTNRLAISAANINNVLPLNGGTGNWRSGDGSLVSTQWLSTTTFKVILSTSGGLPNISTGMEIRPGAAITDLSASSNTAAGMSFLGGDFGSDSTPPLLLEVRTADLNNNGFIDAVRLIFNEPVADATVNHLNFGASGGVSLNAFSSTTNGDVADNSEIYITFTDNMLDTGEKPVITYTPGGLTDRAGNYMASVSLTSLDYAPPLLTQAIANDTSGGGSGIQTSDTVLLVFSEDTNQVAISSSNIMTALPLSPVDHIWLSGSNKISAATWITASRLRISLLNENGAPVLSTGTTIITPSFPLRDLNNNNPSGSRVLTGDFGSTSAPAVLLSIETVNRDGDSFIDAIRFVFDKNISTASINSSDFDISGGVAFEAFSSTVTGNDISDDDFYLTLTDGVLNTSQEPLVSYVQGGLRDINNNLLDSFSQSAYDLAGPALISALAYDGSTGISGIQTGDIIRLTFSEDLYQPSPVINSSNINNIFAVYPSGDWRSGSGEILSANWTSFRTLEIRLSTTSGGPNLSVGVSSITAYSLPDITDFWSNRSTGSALLGGDFGLDITSPAVTAIETADLDSDGYIDAIHFVMSEPILDSSISTGAFSKDGSNVWNVFVSTMNNDVANDNDFYLTFADGQFNTAYRPSIGYIAGSLRDPTGNKLSSFSPQPALDKAPPALLATEAGDNSGQGPGIQTNDVIQLIFSEDISNPPSINAGNVNSTLLLSPTSYAYTWLSGNGSLGQAFWVSASVLRITLDATGGVPRIDASTTVIALDGVSFKDTAGNASGDSVILMGNFGADAISPVLTSRETVDADVDGYIDGIRVVFSEAVKDSSVNINNFSATLNGSPLTLTAFNQTYNGDVANDGKIYLTFQDGVWDTAKTPTLAYSPGTLTDLTGNYLLPSSAASASDKAPPVLRNAIASDGTTLVPGIDSDDTIAFTFSEPTRRPAIDYLNIAQVFGITPATHTFGNITAAWDSETQLTVRFTGTISSSPVSPGDVISIVGNLIDDYIFNVATGSVILTGSFKGQDATAPSIINMSPADDSVGIATGAVVTVTFSENMDAVLVSSAVSLTAVTDNLGAAIDQAVSGTKTFSSVSNVLTFVPSSSLKSNTAYELKVSTLATDTIGNALVNEWRSRFTTQMEYGSTNIVIANDSKTKLDLPPNAIPGNGCVKISVDPVNSPIVVNPAAISAANAKASNQTELTGQQVIGTLREINAYKDGNLWVNSLAAPATITLPYGDANQDGIVDGSAPPIREDTLEIFYLDEKNNLWVRVPGSSVDTQNNIVTVQVSHLSVFALFGAQATDLYSAYAFPVPFVPSDGHQAITFTNLSSHATIEIFTFSGELVRRLENISGANQILWDVTNRVGKEVASGVYLYVIKNAAAKKKGKLMIVR